MSVEQHVEHQCMLDDIAQYGCTDSGVYRGQRWRMRRPYDTYWCAYIDSMIRVDEQDIKELAARSHGGLSSGHGFDCAHWQDYAPMLRIGDVPLSIFQGGEKIFRTHAYVLGKLRGMIDFVCDCAVDRARPLEHLISRAQRRWRHHRRLRAQLVTSHLCEDLRYVVMSYL